MNIIKLLLILAISIAAQANEPDVFSEFTTNVDGDTRSFQSLSLSPNKRHLAMAGYNIGIVVIDLIGKNVVFRQELPDGHGFVRHIIWHENRRILLVSDNQLLLLNPFTKDTLLSHKSENGLLDVYAVFEKSFYISEPGDGIYRLHHIDMEKAEHKILFSGNDKDPECPMGAIVATKDNLHFLSINKNRPGYNIEKLNLETNHKEPSEYKYLLPDGFSPMMDSKHGYTAFFMDYSISILDSQLNNIFNYKIKRRWYKKEPLIYSSVFLEEPGLLAIATCKDRLSITYDSKLQLIDIKTGKVRSVHPIGNAPFSLEYVKMGNIYRFFIGGYSVLQILDIPIEK